jgi:hypothetical protein
MALRLAQRPRRYLPSSALIAMRPAFRYSSTRDAYVLRFVGNRRGPVLRRERRLAQVDYDGPDRRRASE